MGYKNVGKISEIRIIFYIFDAFIQDKQNIVIEGRCFNENLQILSVLLSVSHANKTCCHVNKYLYVC